MESSLQQTHKISPLYTDLYQFTTSYSYFLCGKHNESATFECFFRKHPFKGEYAILGGIREVLAFINNFKISDSDIDYLKSRFPHMKPEYFEYLKNLNTSKLVVDCFVEGDLVFGSQPIISLTGPLALCQILETPLLNLIGFATLVATNASRMVTAAKGKPCVEFGIRRAQGPDGGLTASQYSFLGGFSGTSNVECGKIYNIPTIGTMSHAYITSFFSLEDAEEFEINGIKIKESALKWREKLGFQKTHNGELAAFLMYARAFPNTIVTLIDTYSTLDSGVPNTIILCAALAEAGLKEFGIRLDSGDLSDYAKKSKQLWKKHYPFEHPLKVLASNDLNEDSLVEMEKTHCQIDTYAIGTNIATCLKQPALGLVYKLVELKDQLTMKFSQEKEKITLPGRKNVFRVWTADTEAEATFDLITLKDQQPTVGSNLVVVLASNPLSRYSVTIKKIERLNKPTWNGKIITEPHDIHAAKKFNEARRNTIKKGIFKLEKPEKHQLFMSIDYFKIYEKIIEQNIVLKSL